MRRSPKQLTPIAVAGALILGGLALGQDPFGGGSPFGDTPPPAQPAGDPFAGTPGGTAPAPQPAANDNPFGAPEPTPEMSAAGTEDAAASTSGGVGVTQLYQWRFMPATLWDGTEVVNRVRMTSEDAAAFDQQNIDFLREQAVQGSLPGYQGTDPGNWAKWAYYAHQLQLWSLYVDRVVLAGISSVDSAYSKITWPGTPPVVETASNDPNAGLSGEGAVIAANERTTDDEELASMFSLSSGGDANAAGFDPEIFERIVIQAYQSVFDELRSLEERQEKFMVAFEGRILDRSNRRLAYDDWRRDQEMLLEDFIFDWNRRFNGDVALIGGVRYELYRPGEVPSRVHKDATVVVTDYRLTPYDILNPDTGELREPSR